MVQGTVVVFDAYMENTWDSGIHDFGASPNTIMCAIVNNTAPPVITTANPTWGAAGTNLSTNEVSGGSMTVGGLVCLTATATLNAGTLDVDFGDPATWAQLPGNPVDCYWGVVYDDTATDKNCIGFVDLGGIFDATTGDLTITWGAPFHTVNQP
jgi:hypothetical protein